MTSFLKLSRPIKRGTFYTKYNVLCCKIILSPLNSLIIRDKEIIVGATHMRPCKDRSMHQWIIDSDSQYHTNIIYTNPSDMLRSIERKLIQLTNTER